MTPAEPAVPGNEHNWGVLNLMKHLASSVDGSILPLARA